MRLINVQTFALEEFLDNRVPPYAILSHTWEDEEVSFKDMQNLEYARSRRGFVKIKYTCEQAFEDHLKYAWVDTCCIDKSSSAELQEAINSMYRWYENAAAAYAYLSDVMSSCPTLDRYSRRGVRLRLVKGVLEEGDEEFWQTMVTNSAWFSRGWTLQELIAPQEVFFFGHSWNYIATRNAIVYPNCSHNWHQLGTSLELE